MVCSFLLHACLPSPVCSSPSPGRDLLTRLAVSVFPLCFHVRKNRFGAVKPRNVSPAVCITLRKQKVFPREPCATPGIFHFHHFWLCPCIPAFLTDAVRSFIRCWPVQPCYLISPCILRIKKKKNELLCHCVVKPRGRCRLIILGNAVIFKLQTDIEKDYLGVGSAVLSHRSFGWGEKWGIFWEMVSHRYFVIFM